VLEATAGKLDAIVRAVLELPDGADTAGVSQKSEPKWDSLAHAVLIGAVESEFGLQIDAADSLELTSYSAIARFLEDRGQ